MKAIITLDTLLTFTVRSSSLPNARAQPRHHDIFTLTSDCSKDGHELYLQFLFKTSAIFALLHIVCSTRFPCIFALVATLPLLSTNPHDGNTLASALDTLPSIMA